MKRLIAAPSWVAVAVLAVAGVAFAIWSSLGAGSGIAAATTLAPPGQPGASVSNGTATLTWTDATPPGAGSIDYNVERRDAAGSVWSNACGTSPSVRISVTTCADVPGAGNWVWRVTANFATWTTSGSDSSATVVGTVDATPPTGSITAPAASANVKGTVSVTSNSADAGSGVASAQFQISPAGAATWSNLGTADTTSPYSTSWDTTTFADGPYDLRVITTDNVGLAFTSPVATNVRADNSAPTGAITAPLASTSIRGVYVVTSDSADATSGVASALFQRSPAGTNTWTNVAAADLTAPYSASWTTSGVSDGLYDLRVITTDNAGNSFTSPTTTNVRVDNTAPTGSLTAPASSANIGGTVNVTSNSADAGSGVANVQFQTSPSGAGSWSNLGSDTVSPYTFSWDTTTYLEGIYDLRVITTDNAGNTFTSATITNIRVDNTAPTGSITAPVASANIKGVYVVTSDSADPASGVASALFQRSPSGGNTWTNVAAADVTAPYTASWTTTGVTDGLYDLRVTTTDKAGNTFTSPLVTIRVDNTLPTGAVTAPTASANVRGTINVTSSAADAGSGVASAQFQTSPAGAATWSNLGASVTSSPYSTTWDTTTFTEGLYDLRVIIIDNTANTRTSATIANVRVDNTAPSGSVTAPLDSANIKGTFVVTSDSADAASGVASALFQRSPAGADTWTNVAAADTTSPYTASWVTTGVTDGLYDLRVVTTDKSGNTFTSALVTNVQVDNTKPTVSLALSGATNAVRVGTKIYFRSTLAGSYSMVATVTDGGSGPASATFPILSATGWAAHGAETINTPSDGPYTSSVFSWSSGAVAPGTFTVTVADVAGNTATSATTFTIDNTAPTGNVTAPAAAANVSGTVNVTSNSADAGSGVAGAQFQISPAGAGSWSNLGADTTSPFSTSWDTTAFSEGLYDLRVTTTDNLGITFTSATIANVRVDNTAPTGSLTAPSSNAFISGASVAVSSNSADSASGVASAQFQTAPIGSGTWSNLGAADTTSPYGVTWNTTTFGDGRYDLRVVTTDKAGNTFTSPVVTVEIQNSAPSPTSIQLVNGSGVVGFVDQGDTILATYSQTLKVTSLCSTWSGDYTAQSLTALGDVTVTVSDGGAGNDTVTATSGTCTFHFGSVNLGSTNYVSGGNTTFSGATLADESTVAWNPSTLTLTLKLGKAAGAGVPAVVASSAATYTPDAAIKNGLGTVITGTVGSGAGSQF